MSLQYLYFCIVLHGTACPSVHGTRCTWIILNIEYWILYSELILRKRYSVAYVQAYLCVWHQWCYIALLRPLQNTSSIFMGMGMNQVCMSALALCCPARWRIINSRFGVHKSLFVIILHSSLLESSTALASEKWHSLIQYLRLAPTPSLADDCPLIYHFPSLHHAHLLPLLHAHTHTCAIGGTQGPVKPRIVFTYLLAYTDYTMHLMNN